MEFGVDIVNREYFEQNCSKIDEIFIDEGFKLPLFLSLIQRFQFLINILV